MRIDKYLQVSRILKKRTAGKALGEQQRLKINGRKVKPSAEVKVGDVIEIVFGNRILTIQVNEIKKQVRKTDPPIYTILKEERVVENNEHENNDMI